MTWSQKFSDIPNNDNISISVECEDSPNGSLICAAVPRTKLLNYVPRLKNFVREDNGNILLPSIGKDVYDEALYEIVKAVLAKPNKSTDLDIRIEENYIVCVQHHVVFALLGMERERSTLEKKIWEHLGVYELAFETVAWVWEQFGHFLNTQGPLWPSVGYVPPYADLYIQGMVYQILNLKAIDRLGWYVNEYVYGKKSPSQPHLKNILDEREKKYGLEEGYEKLQEKAIDPQQLSIQSNQSSRTVPSSNPSPGTFATSFFGSGTTTALPQPNNISALHGSTSPLDANTFGFAAPSISAPINTTHTPIGPMHGFGGISSEPPSQTVITPNFTPNSFSLSTMQPTTATGFVFGGPMLQSAPTNNSTSESINNMFAFQSSGDHGSGRGTTLSQRVRKIAQPKGRFSRGGNSGR